VHVAQVASALLLSATTGLRVGWLNSLDVANELNPPSQYLDRPPYPARTLGTHSILARRTRRKTRTSLCRESLGFGMPGGLKERWRFPPPFQTFDPLPPTVRISEVGLPWTAECVRREVG
jgi:hypothetical protein